MNINIVLIEDDPMVREVNRQFIERVEGFEIVAMASNGIEGIEKIKQHKPQLVFMDIFMPKLGGIDTLTQIRSEHLQVDVIAVTAANDQPTIQQMLQLGVFDYIMKPFTFERMEQTLINYRQFKQQLSAQDDFTQQQLDAMIQKGTVDIQVAEPLALQVQTDELPKGFNKATLEKVLAYLQHKEQGASADDVAANVGVARVTARRYLDLMEKRKMIQVDSVYGNIGRPINIYFIEQK